MPSSRPLSVFDSALYVDVNEFHTIFVSCQRMHFMSCSYSEPACMLIKCDPRHSEYMAYGLLHCSDVVQKDFDAALAKIDSAPHSTLNP